MRRWLPIAIAALLAAPRAATAQDDGEDPDAPVLEHVARVVEVVREPGGETAADVVVEAWGLPGGPLVRRTGQDGTVRFDDMPREGIVFVARAEGHVCGWHEPGRWWWMMPEEDTDPDGDGVTRMRLELRPGSEVTGRVLTADGAPLPDAEVVAYEHPHGTDVWYLDGAPLWTARTDANGAFRTRSGWHVAADGPLAESVSARVVASAKGRIHEETGILPRDAGHQDPLLFRLRPASTIRGVVTDRDGSAVPRAVVHAYPSDHPLWTRDGGARRTNARQLTVRADRDGRYELAEAYPGTPYRLFAERLVATDDHWSGEEPVARSHVAAVEAPAHGADAATADLRVLGLGSLRVRIAPDAGGDAENTRIEVLPPEGARPWAHAYDFDEDGEHEVEDADPGTWIVTADASGWMPARLEVGVAPGETTAVEIRLVRGASISGVVQDAQGTPVGDAVVYAYALDPARPDRYLDGYEQTRTDGEGRFTVRGLRPGATALSVRCGEMRSYDRAVVRAPAEDVVLRISSDAVLRVRVRAPGDDPAPARARVTVTIRSGDSTGAQQQEEIALVDGAGDVSGLIPGRATVAVEVPGYAPTTRTVVLQGGLLNEPPVFVLEPGVSLRGRVVDGAGAPVAGARVVPWGNAERAAFAAVDGTFELEHLASGMLELAASARGMAERFVPVGVTELRPPVEIVLTPGALVHGTVRSPSGGDAYVASLDFVPADSAEGTTSRWRVPVEDGAFRLQLPPGRYRCEWASLRERPDEPAVIEVAEGDDVTLDLIRD